MASHSDAGHSRRLHQPPFAGFGWQAGALTKAGARHSRRRRGPASPRPPPAAGHAVVRRATEGSASPGIRSRCTTSTSIYKVNPTRKERHVPDQRSQGASPSTTPAGVPHTSKFTPWTLRTYAAFSTANKPRIRAVIEVRFWTSFREPSPVGYLSAIARQRRRARFRQGFAGQAGAFDEGCTRRREFRRCLKSIHERIVLEIWDLCVLKSSIHVGHKNLPLYYQ